MSSNGTELIRKKTKLRKQFDSCGGFLFSLTQLPPALQTANVRSCLWLTVGALSFEGDEVGVINSTTQIYFLHYIELYDMGSLGETGWYEHSGKKR